MPLERTLLHEISTAIKTKHLSHPVSTAYCLTLDEDSRSAAEALLARQFDLAPIIDNGHPIGIFDRNHWTPGQVRSSMLPLSSEMLIAAEAPISILVGRLVGSPFLFTVDAGGPTGFVTAADLSDAPARTWFYMQLSQTEMALARFLRKEYFGRQEEVLQHINERRRTSHDLLVSGLKASDTFIDHIAAVSFGDLIDIAGADPNFRVRASEASGWGWGKLKRSLPNFRNDVMHPSRTTTDQFAPQKILALSLQLDALFEAAQSPPTASQHSAQSSY